MHENQRFQDEDNRLHRRGHFGPRCRFSPLQNDPREMQTHEIEDLPPISTFVSPDGFVEPIPEETTATGLPFERYPDNLETFPTVVDDIPEDRQFRQTEVGAYNVDGYPDNPKAFPTVVDDIPDDEQDKTDIWVYPAHHHPPAFNHHPEGFNASSSDSTVWKELLQAYYGKDADSENIKHPNPKPIKGIKDLISGHFKGLISAGLIAAPSQAVDGGEAQAKQIEPRSFDQERMWREQSGDAPLPEWYIKHKQAPNQDSSPISASQTTKEILTSPTSSPDSAESSISEFSLPYCPGESGWRPSDHYVDTTHCALVRHPKETPSQLQRRQDDDNHIYKNGKNLLYKIMNPDQDNSLTAETFDPKNNIDYVNFHQKRDGNSWDVEGSANGEFENPWNHQTTEVDADVDWWSEWKRDDAAPSAENDKLQRRDVDGSDIPMEDSISHSDNWKSSQRLATLSNFTNSALSRIHGNSHDNNIPTEQELSQAISEALQVARLRSEKCHIMAKETNSADECLWPYPPSNSTLLEQQINKRDLAGQVEKFKNEIGSEIKNPFADLKNATVVALEDAEAAIEDVAGRSSASVKKFKSKNPGKINVTAIFDAPYIPKRDVSDSVKRAEHDIAARVGKQHNYICNRGFPTFTNATGIYLVDYSFIPPVLVEYQKAVQMCNGTLQYRPSHFVKRGLPESVKKLENEMAAKIKQINQPFKPFNFSAFAHHSVHKSSNHTKFDPLHHKHNTTRPHHPHHPHHKNTTRHTPLAIDGEAAYRRFHFKDFKPWALHVRDSDYYPQKEEKGYPDITPSKEFSQDRSTLALKHMIEKLAEIHKPVDRWHDKEEMTPEKEKELKEAIQKAYERAGYDPSLPVKRPPSA